VLIYPLIALNAAAGLVNPGDDIFAREKALGHIETRIVAKSTDAEYFAFPSVCKLKNGDLLCVFYNGTAHVCPDSKISMVRSTDEGKTWSKPVTIIDTPMDDRDPSIRQTRDGRILVNFFIRDSGTTGAAKQTNKVLVSGSDDGGRTFGEPKTIGTDWLWEATSDEILELKDGTLLLPIYGAARGSKTWGAAVAFSRDGGLTWDKGPIAVVAYDDSDDPVRFEEPALVQLPTGDVICALRTTNADGFIYETRSRDGGKTWTPFRRLGLQGQASNLLYHSGGVVFQAYRDRLGTGEVRGVAGIFRRLGNDWDAKKQFSILNIGGDCAYPSSVELKDGSILTVYYARERRSIESTTLYPAAIKALR